MSSPSPDAGQSTASATGQDAVVKWITAIIEGRPVDACMVSATSPTQAPNTDFCEGDGPQAQQVKDGVERLRESFTPKNGTSHSVVKAAQVPVTGDSVSFTGDDITIDGQTLTEIVLSHSTGIEPGQLELKIQTGIIDGSWFVTGFEFSIG
jgi:hypothetical protein